MKLSHKYCLLLLLLSIIFNLYLHREFMDMDIQGIHSWRQSQTMWNIRNFVRHDSQILNPRVSHFNGGQDNILRYEFPIMQWSIAQIQKFTGEKIWVVRGSMFFIASLGIIGMYMIGRHVFNNNLTGLLTALLFQFSPVFYYYMINPIPDVLALSSAIWYIFFLLKYQNSYKISHLIFASFFLLLATLAKLPYLMFSIVSIYFFFKGLLSKWEFNWQKIIFPSLQLIILSPAFIWYAWVMPDWTGNPVLTGMLGNSLPKDQLQIILEYHLETMFPDLLMYPIVWPLAILGLLGLFIFKKNSGWIMSLALITFVYLFLELNAINTVHDYYMMPFLPWIFLIIGYGVHLVSMLPYHIGNVLMIIPVVLAPLHTSSYTHDFWSLDKTYFNKDVFLYSEKLKNAVPNDRLCIILNDQSNYIFSYQIDKMGHIFNNDHLPSPWINDMINNYNVTHMYSDSRIVDQDSSVQQYLDTLLLKAGSVHVYRLKDPKD